MSVPSIAQLAQLTKLAIQTTTDANLSIVTLLEVSALLMSMEMRSFALPMLVENALMLLVKLTHALQDTSALLVPPAKLLLPACATQNNATILTTFARLMRLAPMAFAQRPLAQELKTILVHQQTFASMENVLSAQLEPVTRQVALKTLLATQQEHKEMSASSIAQLVALGNPAIQTTADANLSIVTLPEVSAQAIKLIIFASQMLVESALLTLVKPTHALLDISARLVHQDKLLLSDNVTLKLVTTPITFVIALTMNV
jgi:hypothetical protein